MAGTSWWPRRSQKKRRHLGGRIAGGADGRNPFAGGFAEAMEESRVR
jgi:hypothetical protein